MPSDAHAWLHAALGCLVEILAEGVRATLLGAVGEGSWEVATCVAPEHGGAPARVLPGALLRRVAPTKGDVSRTVVGSAVGFQGEVLSVESSVAVVRGGAPGARVRATCTRACYRSTRSAQSSAHRELLVC